MESKPVLSGRLSTADQEPTAVGWHNWSALAFEKAESSGKPILLSISAVWCHWCHVMDKTTFSDPTVIRLINANFIPVRVDTDKRPDINRRYNMGGWPTTTFLTSKGEVITGGTYIPPEHMKPLLQQVKDYYSKNRDKASWRPAARTEFSPSPNLNGGNINASIVEEIMAGVVMDFDSKFGGFGSEPKFYHTDALRMMLYQYHSNRDPGLLTMVKKTLNSMSEGGVCDKEMGGFFRYSTKRDWSVPHYEKMCEDNARLMQVYLEAGQMTGEQSYFEVAREIIQYITSSLSDQVSGGFCGSQDADERYYSLSKADRLRSEAPFVDGTLYTDWNAQMVSSYLPASFMLDDPKLAEFALKTTDRILKECFRQEDGMYHYLQDGECQLRGLLRDQAFMIQCLLDAYQSTGEPRFLKYAADLTEIMISKHWDEAKGGFFDIAQYPDALGALKLPDKSLDENAVSALALVRLYYLTDAAKYFEYAKRTLANFTESYTAYGVMASTYGLVVDSFLNPPLKLSIMGDRKDETTLRFVAESWKIFAPHKTIQILDPINDREFARKVGYSTEKHPAAYVCHGQTCGAPIFDPKELRAQIS